MHALVSAGMFDDQYRDSAGCTLLRAGEYLKALDAFAQTPSCADTAQRAFAQGYAQEKLGNTGGARFYYRLAGEKNRLYLPFAYERIGDLDRLEKRSDNALSAWRFAYDSAVSPRYKKAIVKKIGTLALAEKIPFADIPWFADTAAFAASLPGVKILPQQALFDAASAQHWPAIDSILKRNADSNDLKVLGLPTFSYLDTALPARFLSTLSLYRMSALALACKKPEAARSWINEAAKRPDLEKAVGRRLFAYHKALLAAALKDDAEVARWAKEFNASGTPDPWLVFLTARSYRNLDRPDSAIRWYRNYLDLFPKDARADDVRWYCAWDYEDRGINDTARAFFRALVASAGPSRVEDASFRIALSFVKDSLLDSAAASFRAFRKKYPASDYAAGSLYWTGKCEYLLGHADSARAYLSLAEGLAPWDYYGWMSRSLLARIANREITDDLPFDPRAAAGPWLDSLQKNEKPLSPADSLILRSGASFALMGLPEYADWAMEPAADRLAANLSGVYELSRLYLSGGDWARSYRWARRLAYRVPVAARRGLPLDIYRVLYPQAYGEWVRVEAKAAGLEPEYVLSIMRQESTFDHKIMSPVGAMGLMQIMPYTGEEIARDLKDKHFKADSLLVPALNIHYGAYYLRKVLDKMDSEMIYGIASYNGGPHNAIKWKRSSAKDEFDMKVEDVGFAETRVYVKKVLANYWTYRLLTKLAIK